jgi:hypothetical protein
MASINEKNHICRAISAICINKYETGTNTGTDRQYNDPHSQRKSMMRSVVQAQTTVEISELAGLQQAVVKYFPQRLAKDT